MSPRKAPVLSTLDAGLSRVEYLTAWIAGVTIFALMFLVTAEVLFRRLLNNPIPGQQDITILSMATFGVLCVSYCYRQAGHIRMDLVLKLVDGRAHYAMHLLVTLIALFTVTAIWPGTWRHFMRAYEFGDTTFGIGLETWPSKLMAPVGLGILWLRLVLEVFVFLRLIADPDAEPVGMPRPPDPRKEMDT